MKSYFARKGLFILMFVATSAIFIPKFAFGCCEIDKDTCVIKNLHYDSLGCPGDYTTKSNNISITEIPVGNLLIVIVSGEHTPKAPQRVMECLVKKHSREYTLVPDSLKISVSSGSWSKSNMTVFTATLQKIQ